MILVLSIFMDAFFVSILTWCVYSDVKRRTISNHSVILLFCLGLAHLAVMTLAGYSWWQYPASMFLAVPFFIAWLKNGMGAGDVKFVAAISLYLGLFIALVAFALMIPILAVLFAWSWLKRKTLKFRIPLAPVIGSAAAFAVIFGYLCGFICR